MQCFICRQLPIALYQVSLYAMILSNYQRYALYQVRLYAMILSNYQRCPVPLTVSQQAISAAYSPQS